MKIPGWKTPLATLAVAGLMWFPATAPAQAQSVINNDGIVSINNNALKFSGIVRGIGPETVALDVNGTLLNIPMAMVRFEVNGVHADPTQFYEGLPVTVSVGSLRGTVAGMNGGVLTLMTPNGAIELPSMALNSPMLANSMVSFRDINGHVSTMPVYSALDMQHQQMGAIAFDTTDIDMADVDTSTNIATITTASGTTVVDLNDPDADISVASSFDGNNNVSTQTVVAGAPGQSYTYTYPGLTLQGRVHSIQPNMVVVDMNGHLVNIPSSMNATYRVNGSNVMFSDLSAGSDVHIMMPSFTGSVQHINNDMVTIDMGNGTVMGLPMSALPADFRSSSMVWMRDANGMVMQVPLNEALDRQAQGAVIVGPDYDIAVPADDMDFDNNLNDDSVDNDLNNVNNGLNSNGNFDNPIEPANINR